MSEADSHLLSWVGSVFRGQLEEDAWQDADTAKGAFHEIVLGRGVVARVLVGVDHHERAVAEHRTWESWEGLPLPVAVPRLVSDVRSGSGRSGYVVTRLPGTPREDLPWSSVRSTFAALLDALGDVDTYDVRLPPARSWCGGERFTEIVREELAPMLEREGSDGTLAVRVVEQMQELETGGTPRLVHGDLGPHNVLWTREGASGLIDVDHACVADVVIDLAPLVGGYGSRAVREIAAAEDVERARVYRATLSLQVAAAAQLRGAAGLRDHALGTFATRAASGRLEDPDGAR